MSTEGCAGTAEAAAGKELLDRLARVEGQIRGLRRMLEEDRACEEVLTQLLAARSGLEQAGVLVLERHVERCIVGEGTLKAEALAQLRRALRLWCGHVAR
ncbi:Copper-sensing transcriptional repressor RicR [bacterium HR29]|jgi:DNA-binding FrmR family transcriptional regulator|nr:Copper-sensing transcriptional repressor RicR [bacterium HR29]